MGDNVLKASPSIQGSLENRNNSIPPPCPIHGMWGGRMTRQLCGSANKNREIALRKKYVERKHGRVREKVTEKFKEDFLTQIKRDRRVPRWVDFVKTQEYKKFCTTQIGIQYVNIWLRTSD